MEKISFVANELRDKANLYAERNKAYGDNYKRFGHVMRLVLEGQKIDTTDPQVLNRLGILVQVLSKVTRYGENFERGGHDDSLDDIAVYVMMLKELDHEGRNSWMSKSEIVKATKGEEVSGTTKHPPFPVVR